MFHGSGFLISFPAHVCTILLCSFLKQQLRVLCASYVHLICDNGWSAPTATTSTIGAQIRNSWAFTEREKVGMPFIGLDFIYGWSISSTWTYITLAPVWGRMNPTRNYHYNIIKHFLLPAASMRWFHFIPFYHVNAKFHERAWRNQSVRSEASASTFSSLAK